MSYVMILYNDVHTTGAFLLPLLSFHLIFLWFDLRKYYFMSATEVAFQVRRIFPSYEHSTWFFRLFIHYSTLTFATVLYIIEMLPHFAFPFPTGKYLNRFTQTHFNAVTSCMYDVFNDACYQWILIFCELFFGQSAIRQCPKRNLQATATLLKLDNDIAWCIDRSTCRRHARREWRERFKFGSFSF